MAVTRQNATLLALVGGIALGLGVARTLHAALAIRIGAFVLVAAVVGCALRAVLRWRVAREEERR